MTFEFDEALSLRLDQPNAWLGYADPRREATTGMFGGWTAALLLRAVLNDAPGEGGPSTLSVHFIKPIAPGKEVAVRTHALGGSRSVSFWKAELAVAGTDGAAAIATVVLSKRRESLVFTEMSAPTTPPIDTLPEFHPPGNWGKYSEYRVGSGFLPFNRESTQSLCWIRDRSGRPLDHLQLAYQADNFPPRSWYKSAQPSPYSTLTMSVYFHASDQEMAELGDDFILLEASGTRAESSTVGARANIWSRAGALLATTEQMGWFR